MRLFTFKILYNNIAAYMDNIQIKNYRCFDDTGTINIKPITLLVGANSSGKSSFLKLFGLIKQSVSEFVRGCFLWSGPLIDFKDFDNVAKNSSNPIELDFDIAVLPIYNDFKMFRSTVNDVHLHLEIGKVDPDFEYDILRKLVVTFDGNIFELHFYPDRSAHIIINGVDSTQIGDVITWGLTNSLFPKIAFSSSKEGTNDERSYKIFKRMQEILNKTSDREEQRMFLPFRFRHGFNMSKLKEIIVKQGRNKLSEEEVDEMAKMSMYLYINTFLDSLNFYMLHLSKKMTYVMPLRAIVQRYYRYNNYAVDSIDADGGNLPMFFNGLSDQAFDEFNDRWLEPIFGFRLKIGSSGDGHVELLIEEKGKPERNLIDVGFGYTQILPILTILWKAIMIDCVNTDEKEDFCKTHIVAIEQPELHLHPRFQGMFVDMLDKVIEICHKCKKDVRIMIETHSEVIVNRLGIKVMDDNAYIKTNDVNVLLFNAKAEGYDTDVISSSYNEEGYLINWPFGFFSDNVY